MLTYNVTDNFLRLGMIKWDDILPTMEWIESHVPASIRPHCLVRPPENTNDIDYETINQAYCNIIAGAGLVLGMRFAGTANAQVNQKYIKSTELDFIHVKLHRLSMSCST